MSLMRSSPERDPASREKQPDVTSMPWLIAAAGMFAGAILLVAWLGDMISDGAHFAFDQNILLWARGGIANGTPVGPLWFRAAMVDITALGGTTALVLIVTLVSGFLMIRYYWFTLALVLAGTVSGSIVVVLIKNLVGRERPTLTDHLVQVSSLSFPSGHAANSAIVYLTMAVLINRTVSDRIGQAYISAAAVLLVGLIGFSRVYVGVHWPSDVLAGWAFGTLWAVAWWAIGKWAADSYPSWRRR